MKIPWAGVSRQPTSVSGTPSRQVRRSVLKLELRRREIAVGETKLEAADRGIIAEIVAWLRRVVAGEHDRHGLFVDGLWIVDAAVNSTISKTVLQRKCLMRLILE
jgi:hypothetical protein